MTGAGRWQLAARLAALAVGLALLAWSVHYAGRQVDASVLRQADPAAVLGIAAAVLANLVLTGVLFWLVTRPFDARPTVGLVPMTALIAASALLNYLPLRPGLLGRAAYLKVRHDLPLRQSAMIFVIVSLLSGFILTATVLVVVGQVGGTPVRSLLLGLVGLLLLSPLSGVLGGRLLRRPMPGAWAWVAVKTADMLVNGLRLWLAFQIVGEPVPYALAVAMSAVGMVANFLVPLIPNGLGVREWLVGGMTALLLPLQAGTGVAATLVDRAVEAVVCVLVGLPATVWLRRGGAIDARVGGVAIPSSDTAGEP
jgi:hypothetical protein